MHMSHQIELSFYADPSEEAKDWHCSSKMAGQDTAAPETAKAELLTQTSGSWMLDLVNYHHRARMNALAEKTAAQAQQDQSNPTQPADAMPQDGPEATALEALPQSNADGTPAQKAALSKKK